MCETFKPLPEIAYVLGCAQDMLTHPDTGFGYVRGATICHDPQEPVMPHYVLETYGARVDKMTLSPEMFYMSVMSEPDTQTCTPAGVDRLVGCISTTPSPHFPAHEGSRETHLVGWWWGKELDGSLSRQDILGLARDPEIHLQAAYMLAGLMRGGINRIRNKFGLSEMQALDKIKAYGLSGHATPKEREKGDTGRGGQSAEVGHINFAFKEKDELAKVTQMRVPTLRDFMKSVDPYSTAVVRRLNGTLMDHFQRMGEAIDMCVTSEEVHTVRNDQENGTKNPIVRFAENFDFTFSEPKPIEQGFKILLGVYGDIDYMYTQVFNMYIEYWRTGAIPKTERAEYSPLMRMIISDIPAYPLTYGLVQMLLSDTHNPLTGTRREELERHKSRLQQRRMRLYIEEERNQMAIALSKRYKIDLFSARSVIDSFVVDQVTDPKSKHADKQLGWQKMEFIFSKYFSSSYRINWAYDESGEVIMNGFSISPHFASVKGGAEDLNGGIVVRDKGL